MFAPPLVGFLVLRTHQIGAIFLSFAAVGIVGAPAVSLFVGETSGKALAEVSP